MRRVDRTSVQAPEVLAGPKSRGVKELGKATEFFEALAAEQAALKAKLEADIAAGIAPLPAPPKKKGKKDSFPFSAYSDDGVKYALDQLFFGKCAYCETRYANQAPVDVEHYRPKGRISGEKDHPGYWWLAMIWDNLLPSCIDCNRRRWQRLPDVPSSLEQLLKSELIQGGMMALGKQDVFPVEGERAVAPHSEIDEKPDLLNPCVDVPDEHLTFYIDRENPLGLVLPKITGGVPSRRGLTSIHVYGLNRLALVQERTRVLRTLEFLSRLIDEIDEISGTLLARRSSQDKKMGTRLSLLSDQILGEIKAMAEPDRPYSSLVKAWSNSLKP